MVTRSVGECRVSVLAVSQGPGPRARVEAEVASQQQPDDESADALRAAAPESRVDILEPVPVPE